MKFNVKVSTVADSEFSEIQFRESFWIECESLEDAEEAAVVHIEKLAKDRNEELWGSERLVFCITPVSST